MWFYFRKQKTVAQRRAAAAREIQKRKKSGIAAAPVVIEGRAITKTFWGNAWCGNLESYSDFANRLPRGRSYVRHGSVVDLRLTPGKIAALVSGSSLYEIEIAIAALPEAQWADVKSRCAGEIGSLVELLQGRLSKSVMDIVTARDGGLFPKPREIKMQCSCPDSAGMCKHLAAVMYGVGARLDLQPELLFQLRQVDHLELIEAAVPGAGTKASTNKTLEAGDVAGVFGIEFAQNEAPEPAAAANETEASPKPAKANGRAATSGRRTTKTTRPKAAAARQAKKPKAVKK